MTDIDAYTAFPTVDRRYPADIQTIIDAVALVGAACAAISDPLATVNGRSFPSVFSLDGEVQNAGKEVPIPGNYDPRGLKREIALGCGRFCDNYAANIGRYILGDHSGSERVSVIMASMFTVEAEREGANHHFAFKSVAPFFG